MGSRHSACPAGGKRCHTGFVKLVKVELKFRIDSEIKRVWSSAFSSVIWKIPRTCAHM
jgi:hypothetical protein